MFSNIIKQYERQPYSVDGRVLPNFGTLRGKVDKALGTYVDFVTERERWCTISTDHTEGNASAIGMWNEAITAAFQKYCLDRWKEGFSDNMLAVRDMLLMSKGAFIFDDDFSAYPSRTSVRNVMPDSNASMFPDSFDVLFVHKRLSAIDLYRKIKNKDHADLTGWRREAILELLRSSQTSWRSETHESLFLRFGSGAITQTQQDTQIDLVYAYVKEYDDKDGKGISQFIFPVLRRWEEDTSKKSDEEMNKVGYLFYGRCAKKSMSKVIALLAHTVCENFYEDPSFAQLMYTFSKTYDMVMNRVLQGIEDNMRVYLRSDSPDAMSKLQRMRHGNWQVLAPGMKLEQDRIVRPVQESMMVLNKLMVDTNAAFGQYTVGEQEGRAMPKTAKQSEIDYGEAQVTTTSQMKLFNCFYTLLMAEMYKRWVDLGDASQLTEEEQKNYDLFKKSLKDQKVPAQAWASENVQVGSVMTTGAGSPSAKLQSMQIVRGAMAIAAATPGEQLVKRQMIGAAVGVSNINAYLPPDDTMLIGEDSLIGIENDALSAPDCNPNNVQVINNQLHMRHIPRHIEDASLSMQAAGKLFQALQGMPKADIGVYLAKIQDISMGIDNKMAHAQAHMMIAARDKDPQVQMALKQIAQHMQSIHQAQDQLSKAVQTTQIARVKDDQQQSTVEQDPVAAHQQAMFSMKEQHAKNMMDLDFQNHTQKAQQLREQSAANMLHKADINTALGEYDLRMKQLEAIIKLGVAQKKAQIQTTKIVKKQ